MRGRGGTSGHVLKGGPIHDASMWARSVVALGMWTDGEETLTSKQRGKFCNVGSRALIPSLPWLGLVLEVPA